MSKFLSMTLPSISIRTTVVIVRGCEMSIGLYDAVP